MPNAKPDWIRLTKEIGPKMSAYAAAHDREGSFVSEAYAELERLRFFSLAVPGELGGGDASFEELCQVVREIAHHDPSVALAYSMHSHLVAAAVWKFKHGQPGEKLLRKVADDQAVLLSTGATDWIDSNGTMTRVDGGYRFSARKVFGSGGPAAKLMIASGRYEDPDEGSMVLHFPVPMNAEGVSLLGDWDTLGMRGTGSNTVVLEDVFISEESIALRRPAGQWHPAWSVVITVAPPIYMAAYVGIAERAAEIALERAAKRIDSPHLPYAVGELRNALHSTRVLWEAMLANAANYDFAPTLERADRALAGKTLVSEAAKKTVALAMEVAGGGGFFRKSGLERLFRDVQGAPFHPLPERRQLHFSGRIGLGLDPITGAPLGD